MQNFIFLFLFSTILAVPGFSQKKRLYDDSPTITKYTNPILHLDYSDPDVIRVGNDYYMTASSFSNLPGLPILHSRDLINWKIIGHAVQTYPFSGFIVPQHGNGIWAPAIRYYKDTFYIYFGDPDRGILMTRAKNPAGPWEPLRLIRKVTGWIDPCPFWDDDGNTYIIHAFANSRCGIKSILAINRMSPQGTEIFDDGIIVFNGQKDHPTIEGPKLYKRNGYYYIFAPAGGVKTGWQTVLRAKNIFGPYEDRIALEQGNTKINGPHQGAWITTPTGTDWFVHFQDRYAYGRIVHLQPVQWINDWPVMGIDLNGNGIGEPVGEYSTPLTGTARPDPFTQTSDDFDSSSLGLQWQWQSNSKTEWYSLTAKNGLLRLYSQPSNANDENLWNTGALLMQKFPRDKFSLTVKLALKAHSANNKAGLLIFGMDYSYIALEKTPTGFQVTHRLCNNANSGKPEQTIAKTAVPVDSVFLRVSVEESNPGDIIPKVNCSFAYSLDGKNFMRLGGLFTAREGKWVGAKVGLFCTTTAQADTNDNADIDWIRFED